MKLRALRDNGKVFNVTTSCIPNAPPGEPQVQANFADPVYREVFLVLTSTGDNDAQANDVRSRFFNQLNTRPPSSAHRDIGQEQLEMIQNAIAESLDRGKLTNELKITSHGIFIVCLHPSQTASSAEHERQIGFSWN